MDDKIRFIGFTNNGSHVKFATGCWLCKYLEYIENTSCETLDGGWSCSKREVDNFKDFPCKRKLKCFEKDDNDKINSKIL